ncbi:MAG: hypothetical protein AAFN18_17315 [Cyanobacteria bacterium J06554_6]
MKKYVMFGHNHLLGDLVEIIHANGDVLTKIVQNVPEPVHPTRPPLQERLERLQSRGRNPLGVNQFYPIDVQPLADFLPQGDEHYVIGFTGFKMSVLCQRLHSKFNIRFDPLIHPTAIVSPTAQIGAGVIINAGTIVASGTSIEAHSAINKGVIIGHDTVLGRYAIVQPGVRLAGHIHAATGSVIGIGATVIEDLTIGAYSMVAAGAVVIRDVPAHALVAGTPAVVKKEINLAVKAPT